jgi:hypothetical protein
MKGLISDRHRDLYMRHYDTRVIEPRPSVWLPRIELLADMHGARTVVDYGCGAARGVSRFSRLSVTDYDPAVPGCEAVPDPADMVVSVHALEHVEPESVDAVIDHMRDLALRVLLVVVSCEESTKTLPDGSPWHSFVKPYDYWLGRLSDFRPIVSIKDPRKEFAAVLEKRP